MFYILQKYRMIEGNEEVVGMKILLTAINAKYIHSNLAVYSLKAYAKENIKKDLMEEIEIELAEYTINQPVDAILQEI